VLGRNDIGHLAPGMCADLALFDLRTLGFAGGAVHDPVGSLMLCDSAQAAYTVVNGKVVVREGRLAAMELELEPLLVRHNALAVQLAQAASHALRSLVLCLLTPSSARPPQHTIHEYFSDLNVRRGSG
jgi:8-oxoguanine deaminase